MSACYVISGWIFTKSKEDSNGNCYFDITNPSGLKWDYDHLFHSYNEMITYVNNQ